MELMAGTWTLSLLGMVGCLCYQGFVYLRTGQWMQFSATDACTRYLKIDWCAWPGDWIGVHRMLSEVNAGVLVFAVISLACWIAITAGDTRRS